MQQGKGGREGRREKGRDRETYIYIYRERVSLFSLIGGMTCQSLER
jgi:hypothetical protein